MSVIKIRLVVVLVGLWVSMTWAQKVASPALVPAPSDLSLGSASLSIHPESFSFQPDATAASSAVVQAALKRYQPLLFPWGSVQRDPALQEMTTIAIELGKDETRPYLGCQESYEIEIYGNGTGRISAPAPWGILSGLETFSQMVTYDVDVETYAVQGVPALIKDKPAFPYRGLLVDTARHFLPLTTLLRIIDGMTYNKLNVMHWHATDAESAPVESQTYPLLAPKGAFSKRGIFSTKDLQVVVEYARLRGIRVLIEFDMPGHNYAFGLGYPDLIMHNCTAMQPLTTEFWASSFNPVRESTYDFVRGFLKEMTAIFPDAVIHLGGDEVVEQCWDESAEVHAFMKANNMTDLGQVYTYFEKRVHAIARDLNRTVQSWDEVFVNARSVLPEDAIVQVYRGLDTLKDAVQAGHRAVLSSSFYFNQGFDYGGVQIQWSDILKTNITPPGLDAASEKLLLGAEASVWGEDIDQFNFDQRVWFRAGAFGERLWVNASQPDLSEFTSRIIPHRCRLLQRGLQPCPYDSRDLFPRRSLEEQCELLMPPNAQLQWMPFGLEALRV